MSYLFDASALLNSVRLYNDAIIDFVEGNECYALTLTRYEVGNALWKEAYLVKRIEVDQAIKVLNFINSLLNLMSVIDVSGHEREVDILLTAIQMGLTFYDASYLLIAKSLKATLITDDDDIVKASKRVEAKTLRSRDLPIKKLG
ncbi:MAG: hypothetical protein DRJ97_01505 [Thermoprotei archaeon]|nr:MAG: hypothetical protein DRJ97_01505 [Thermoprotei archaeon]